jgi:hypothetical protein
MARAFTELEANPSSAELSHAEWLALLLDREATERYDRRLSTVQERRCGAAASLHHADNARPGPRLGIEKALVRGRLGSAAPVMRTPARLAAAS